MHYVFLSIYKHWIIIYMYIFFFFLNKVNKEDQFYFAAKICASAGTTATSYSFSHLNTWTDWLLLIHLSSNQAQFSSPLPPTTVTFTCHTDFIFTATTAHLPALSPDCQSAASRLHSLTIHHRPKAPDHNIRYKHRHQQPSDPAHDGRMLLLTNWQTCSKLRNWSVVYTHFILQKPTMFPLSFDFSF